MGLFKDVFNVRKRVITSWLSVISILLISGCASTPRPELPVPLEISITASESLNPTEGGRASPVLLRIFELSEPTFFQSADFFTLLDDMSQAQHAEVMEIHEFTLMPGEIRVLRRRTDLATRFLGVAAAYRDLEGSSWRALTAVPPPRRARRWRPSETSPQQRYRIVAGKKSVVIEQMGQ